MSFISRFLRLMKDEDDLEETEESLETGAEEGLLMSTGARLGGPAEEGEPVAEAGDSHALSALEAPQGEAATMAPEEGAQRQGTTDDLVDAAQGGAAASGPEEASPSATVPADSLEASTGQETGATAGSAEQEDTQGGESPGAQDDDPLSAFRSTVVENEMGELTKDIEDTPIEELLTGLREMRSLLPTPPAADGGAGEDGEG